MKHLKDINTFNEDFNPLNWKRKPPPIPESGEERKAWLNKYDPMPKLGDWEAREAWLNKYDPDWLERSNREMQDYRDKQRIRVEEANTKYSPYLVGCSFKITDVTDDGDDQDITYYDIENENSKNENEIFFTLVYYGFRKYAILLVKRRREDYEIDEGMWDYEIKRQIKMPDIETGLRWIKRNWMKPLDKKNTDTVKDEDPNRNPGFSYDYTEKYIKKNPFKNVNLNTPDTSTFDNYKYKR